MPKPMRLRDVNRALASAGCSVKTDTGEHTKWVCPCGQHTANIPRHNTISPGVVGSAIRRMGCLPKGWLQ